VSPPHASERIDVAIVGGGVTGLAAAHRLHELARERGCALRFRLFESGERFGGQVRTERRPGLLLEGGPDQFVRHKPAALDLCRRLGLAGQIVELDERGGATQIVRRGRPVRLPEGFSLLGPTRLRPLARSPLFSWWGLLRVALEPLVRPRPAHVEDESLRSFVTRRFGRQAHDRVFEPMVAGIFTADSAALSLELTVPQWLEMERRHGSVRRALRRRGAARPARGGCVSLAEGLGRLVEGLVHGLPPGSLRAGAGVLRVKRLGRGLGWRVELPRGEHCEATAVILACPARAGAALLEWDAALARELAGIRYASCATVNLVYPERALGAPLDGYGFFVGRAERLPILACSHVSVKFPERVPAGRVLLRAFLGGARDPHLADLDEAELARVAHQTVAGLLRIEGQPEFARALRFPESMPQYPVGFRARLAAIAAGLGRHPGLFAGGGAAGAIGLPDCVASGEAAALAAFDCVAAQAEHPPIAAFRAATGSRGR